jgi:uncharacterized protein
MNSVIGMDAYSRSKKMTSDLVQIESLPKYRPSRFNAHTTTTDGTLILYNSYTGKNCGIPAKFADAAANYLSATGTEGTLDRLGNYLRDNGYIIEESVDEDARWDSRYGQQQYRNDILQLILLSSEDCNFRCIYCSQHFKRGSMHKSVREGVLNLIKKKIVKLNGLSVNWFGGEPLLGWDAIEEIAPQAQELAHMHGASFSSNVTTNGYLLTPDRSRKMVQWGILHYQISVDGAAAEHDAHRPLKEGGGTYAKILENIYAMKEFPDDFHVYLRVNFDRTNKDKLTPLFETYKEKIGSDPRFQVIFFPVGQWGGPNDAQLDVCGYHESVGAVGALSAEARSIGLNTPSIVESIKPISSNVCYAARPYNYIVGSDGKLMKCTVVLDTEERNIVGHLAQDGTIQLDQDKMAAWIRPYYKTDHMCTKCFFVPVCQGASCPLPRVVGEERPCPPNKLSIQQTLVQIWEEKRHTSEARLVQIR